jgi:hypothetical protein
LRKVAFELFDEYAAAHARGERPDAADYLQRAGAEAADLASLLDAFLAAVPAPAPRDEDVTYFQGLLDGESALLAARVARGVKRDTLVDALIRRFDLDHAKREKVKRYYHELESGLLDVTGVDRRVFAALAEELKTRAADLVAWRPRPVEPTGQFLRVTGAADAPRVMARSLEPAPAEEDEIDRLFGIGPQ